MLHKDELGVHPPGALGVGFFVHARADCFIGRGGGGITQQLKVAGVLNLLDAAPSTGSPAGPSHRTRSVSLSGRIFTNLLEADALDRVPELLLVCCNPDQLGSLTGELTRFLENLAERGRLSSLTDIRRRVPILLILPNGILYEQTLQTYEDQLHESLLMQRLPGVTEAMARALLDRVVRGISLQAGGRRGSGPDAVYVLERKGALVFAGGGEAERERIEAILNAHDYAFTHARDVPGTRIEFDKAMISIVLNVGGFIHTVKSSGELLDVRMGDLCKDPTKQEFVRRTTRAVFDVGLAAGAYPQGASYDDVWAKHREIIMGYAGHVTSSLKSFRDAMANGLSGVKLFSNEEWILTPLCHYAANAGLTDEEALFKSLKHDVQAAMARAIRYRDQSSQGRSTGTTHMNLAAQRNITVELFEDGEDNAVMVGTMLDNEHLIKLEMDIYLPDEQIVRSKLNMIRVPFPVCREVEAVAESLVGLRIERGVLSEIVRRVGGRVGCSHIKELATDIVYFAASYLVRRRAGFDSMGTDFIQKPPEERFVLTKELLRDTCLAYCQTTAHGLDEQIGIKRVGDVHTAPVALGEYATSLGVLLEERAGRFGDKVFLRSRFDNEERSLTWAEFYATVQRIARNLIDQGVRPGDRMAMISENRPEMFLFDLASMIVGAVSIPVFAGYLPRQIAYVLGHARPKWVVVSGNHQLEKIERNRHPWIKRVYAMDCDADSRAWGAQAFEELTAEPGSGGGIEPDRSQDSQDILADRISSVRADDVCLVMYTSGTTGPPKGVKLTHRNIISQQKAVSILWDVSEEDVIMSYLPWHHSFGGIFERFLALDKGCEFCLDDSYGRNIDRMIENWKVFNPSLFFSVPRVHELLVTRCRERADVERIVLGGRLRFVFTAGAPLPATVAAAYRERNIPVLEGWGLTETSPSVTLTTADRSWKSGYVGFPIPGVSVRIDDDQEILVKGPNVMEGYLDDEEATSHVIDKEGWFRTGDLGEFTKEGLRIFGRRDGAFKLTTGEKVHPQRIETIFVNESPFISQLIALGSGQNFVGALVYPDMSCVREWAAKRDLPSVNLLGHPEVRELFAEEIARFNPLVEVKYQRVRRAVLCNGEPSLANGELTPSGKLVRRAVLDHHRHELEILFAPTAGEGVIVVDRTDQPVGSTSPQADTARITSGRGAEA